MRWGVPVRRRPAAEAADTCEWDPATNARVAPGLGHAKATISVGCSPNWRLCADCAELPQFKRLWRRVFQLGLDVESKRPGA